MRAKFVLNFYWHLGNLAQLVSHHLHCLYSLQGQLIVFLVLDGDHFLLRALSATIDGASTAANCEGALVLVSRAQTATTSHQLTILIDLL